MTNPPSPWAFILEIIIGIAGLGLASLLASTLRARLAKKGRESESAAVLFFRRVSLPAIFLAVGIVLKARPLRDILPVRPGFFDVVQAAVIFFAVVLVISLADALVQAWFRIRRKPYPVPGVLHGFCLAIIYLIMFFNILQRFLHINITPFLTTSAILTAIIGLALQGVLGNILAGLSLHFSRSFSRGEWIKIGETEGIVIETNWRETRILDRLSNMVVLPNSAMAGGTITNFSEPDKKSALRFPLKIGYEAPPGVVLATLKEAARETAGVIETPTPLAYIIDYDNLGVSYLLKFWVNDYARKFSITTDVARLIWYKFKRRGIDIPVPMAEEISRFLQSFDKDKAARVAEADKERITRDLSGSSFLRNPEGEKGAGPILSGEEMKDLAGSVRRVSFTPGDVLFRQGEKGDICYVVVKGKIKGKIVTEENGKEFVTEFRSGAGGLVGEMSLFSGMPRTATVIAEEESELLEISAEAFAGLLARNPGLADAVAETVSRRNLGNVESLKKIRELSAKDLEAGTSKKSVLEYLKKLVSLFRKD